MSSNPIFLGTGMAFLAAVAFGAATPFIQRFGAGLGPFTTAALLYLGAVLGTFIGTRRHHGRAEATVQGRFLPRLLVIAFFGAVLAPSLFVWGLQRVPATYGSLLLNGEVFFTVGLAALIGHEHIGRRIFLAVGLMFAGGAMTIVGAASGNSGGLLGALAVMAAVFFWALDNVLTRPFADLDPAVVVRFKALFGVALTGSLALILGEKIPSVRQLAGLLVCGASGYGLSLRFYLLAQRRIGAARTGSIFAVAPFVGAITAVLLGDRNVGIVALAAALLFIAGLVLHLTEKHGHRHTHTELEHDHAHSHDDDHHDHEHEIIPLSAHAHPHRHTPRCHAHAHGPDAHHPHQH